MGDLGCILTSGAIYVERAWFSGERVSSGYFFPLGFFSHFSEVQVGKLFVSLYMEINMQNTSAIYFKITLPDVII